MLEENTHLSLSGWSSEGPAVQQTVGRLWAGLPSRMTVMGLGRKPSPPGHRVLYSAVGKVSQEILSQVSSCERGQGGKNRIPGKTDHEHGDSGPG